MIGVIRIELSGNWLSNCTQLINWIKVPIVFAIYTLSKTVLYMLVRRCPMKIPINMMDSKISSETRYAKLSSTSTLSNPLYSQGILQSHAIRLRNVIEVIQRRESPEWPRSLKTKECQLSDTAANKLARDYSHLLCCAESLLHRCEKGMHVAMNQASIRESEMALAQNGRMDKLALLAFLISVSFWLPIFQLCFVGYHSAQHFSGGFAEFNLSASNETVGMNSEGLIGLRVGIMTSGFLTNLFAINVILQSLVGILPGEYNTWGKL